MQHAKQARAAAWLLGLALALPASAQELSDASDTTFESTDAEVVEEDASETTSESAPDAMSEGAPEANADDVALEIPDEGSEAEDDASDGKTLKRKLKGFLAGLLLPEIERRLRKHTGDDAEDSGLASSEDGATESGEPE
jgi:hypothetical protein